MSHVSVIVSKLMQVNKWKPICKADNSSSYAPSLNKKWKKERRWAPSYESIVADLLIQGNHHHKHTTHEAWSIPLPRSSGSAWTTTARPMIEFAPLKGIWSTIPKQTGISTPNDHTHCIHCHVFQGLWVLSRHHKSIFS